MSARKRTAISSDSDPSAARQSHTLADKEWWNDVQETYINPEDAIVVRSDGSIQINNVDITPVGFDVESVKMTEADYEQFGRKILQMNGVLQWLIGDWLAYGELREWKETIERVAALFERNIETIYDYTYVALNVPFSVRTEQLSFAHHKLVAGIKDVAVQADWLHLAARGGWTVAEMREQMRRDGARQELDPTTRLTNNLRALWNRNTKDAGPQERRQMLDAICQWVTEIENSLDDM